MSQPFFFQPEKPVASTRPSAIKEYECKICGKIRPASEMVYLGAFMEVVRDKTKFGCREHL